MGGNAWNFKERQVSSPTGYCSGAGAVGATGPVGTAPSSLSSWPLSLVCFSFSGQCMDKKAQENTERLWSFCQAVLRLWSFCQAVLFFKGTCIF